MFVGGYLVTIIGILGILGNILAFGVLIKIENKNDLNVILAGKKLPTIM